MRRILICVTVFATASGWAQSRPLAPVDCDDKAAECQEDCTIKWGGTTSLKAKAKLGPCLQKCTGVEVDCREMFFEAHRNNLDPDSISSSPSSRDVDSDGLPTRTSAPKGEDRRRPELPAARIAEKTKQPDSLPVNELKETEVPRSSRSPISKVDEQKEKPKVEAKSALAVPDLPSPRREESNTSSGLDSDVRVEDSAGLKKAQKPEEPPRKKEEKKRPLDEWDPDAF